MIEDVAKALKKEIAATHRYFFDSVLEHKYSFKVSVLRVTLINELFDRIRDFKKGLKDIPAGLMGPGITADEQRAMLDKEFDDAGGIQKILKDAAEDGIRKTFINKAEVKKAFDGNGALGNIDLFGNKTKRQKYDIKPVNKNALNVIFEKGQVGKRKGQAAKSQRGAYQTILSAATKELYREARSIAFDYIEANATKQAGSKQGQGKGPGMRSAGGKANEKKLLKGHGRARGLGMAIKPQEGEDQTTVAVLSLAKDFARIQGTKKFKMSAKYDQDILDSVTQVKTEILNNLELEYGLERFQDVNVNEFDEDTVVDIHATDHKGNRALRHFDANGIREEIDRHVEKHIIPAMTAGLSGPKAIQMKGSMSKKDLIVKNRQRQIIEALLKVKGTRPDFRLKVNKKLLAEAKKAKGQKRAKAKPFTSGKKKTSKGSVVTFGAVKSQKGYQKSKFRGQAGAKTSQSPIALRNLLNEALPAMVASKMTGPPTLQFRTGRFANSAEVENVNIGPRGGVGVDYTYMRDPYETFEPGNKQGSTYRDPRRIIGQSIRELAIGILGKQPTSIRRV